MTQTRTHPSPIRRARRPVLLATLSALTLLVGPATTLGATTLGATTVSTTKEVRYHGVSVTVPTSWPVFRVSATSTTCVRFDRHAVYLGTPGSNQSCPPQIAGRTEAILISPENAGDAAVAARGALTPVSTPGDSADDSMLRLVRSSRHVVITATWDRDPQLIRRALQLSSLSAAARATNGHAPKKASPSERATRRSGHAGLIGATAATPGEVYSGLGFDACSAPSESTMTAWSASPYEALGIYIGGADMACPQQNLTSAWVSAESAAGWHLIPTYVGLQAPTTSCTCQTFTAADATSEGTAAAEDAVTQAQALGIGAGNPIYYDMEAYTRTNAATSAVLAFLEAWTLQLHASGYESGVYSSGASGIADLVNATTTSGYTEPDDIWVADWNDQPTTTDPYLPSVDWTNSQRLHQYVGAHNETYGGVQINIDGDYLDGATAAAGTTTAATPSVASAPSLSVRPRADGGIALTPNWNGESGIAQYQILGGPSATRMTSVATVPATTTFPIVVDDAHAFYEVQALSATGTVVGTSEAQETPPSDSIFGNSAFVGASGTIGVPVRCMNVRPCEVHGAIFEGAKRLTHIVGQYVSAGGGVVRFPVTSGVLRAVDGVTEREVTVDVVTSTGRKVTRKLELVPFKTSGPAPSRQTGQSSTLRILSKTDFVSNGWVGGVLVTCTSITPCELTTRVTTRSGALISSVRSQTLGSGETGYLAFRLSARGHMLLQASPGNQLPARVTVMASATSSNGGTTTSGTVTKATVSLVSFR